MFIQHILYYLEVKTCSLKFLKKYNIIENIDGAYALGDSRIIIYPTCLLHILELYC